VTFKRGKLECTGHRLDGVALESSQEGSRQQSLKMWINPRRPEKNRAKNRTRQRSAGEHDGREQERFDLRHPAPTQTLSSRSLVPRHPIGETPARDWKKMMVSDGRDWNFRWAIVFKYI
jgi:hypothetical protein